MKAQAILPPFRGGVFRWMGEPAILELPPVDELYEPIPGGLVHQDQPHLIHPPKLFLNVLRGSLHKGDHQRLDFLRVAGEPTLMICMRGSSIEDDLPEEREFRDLEGQADRRVDVRSVHPSAPAPRGPAVGVYSPLVDEGFQVAEVIADSAIPYSDPAWAKMDGAPIPEG
ncbi:MAG: hypothetical protein WAV26_04975 [Candidatus Deferrimicrobium sp.]